MTDIVRVLRILEYVGPRSWVEATLTGGAVPAIGQHILPNGTCIRSAIIGSYPEILEKQDAPS